MIPDDFKNNLESMVIFVDSFGTLERVKSTFEPYGLNPSVTFSKHVTATERSSWIDRISVRGFNVIVVEEGSSSVDEGSGSASFGNSAMSWVKDNFLAIICIGLGIWWKKPKNLDVKVCDSVTVHMNNQSGTSTNNIHLPSASLPHEVKLSLTSTGGVTTNNFGVGKLLISLWQSLLKKKDSTTNVADSTTNVADSTNAADLHGLFCL